MCLWNFSHSYIQDEVIAKVIITKSIYWVESRKFLFIGQASRVKLAAVNIVSIFAVQNKIADV